MKIEIGKSYTNARGDKVDIAGPTRDYPDKWYWSLQGDWYVAATGRFLTYLPSPDRKTGEHIEAGPDFARNLIQECE